MTFTRLTIGKISATLRIAVAAGLAQSLAPTGLAAQAQEVRMDVIVPSPYWQHHPYLAGKPTMFRVPRDELSSDCSGLGSVTTLQPVDACTQYTGKPGWPASADGLPHCTIYIAKDNGTGEKFRLLVQHEDAHCRGWPGDHPDGPR